MNNGSFILDTFHGRNYATCRKITQSDEGSGELGLVLGKRAKHVSQEQAVDYIAGYVNGNNVSARDLQLGDRQWVRGKSLDTFYPIGPYLVTRDEVPAPQNLGILAILNDVFTQDSSTWFSVSDHLWRRIWHMTTFILTGSEFSSLESFPIEGGTRNVSNS